MATIAGLPIEDWEWMMNEVARGRWHRDDFRGIHVVEFTLLAGGSWRGRYLPVWGIGRRFYGPGGQ